MGLLADPPKRLAMSERAAAYGRSMVWPAVARSYAQSFARARQEHGSRRRTTYQAKTLATRPVELPDARIDHLQLMTDETGMLQHAAYTVPRYDDGYCLDDNARALLVMAHLEEAGTANLGVVRGLSSRYLAFVSHAFNAGPARFRNFLSYDRRWLEECGSEDSHGRALWALGTVVGRSLDRGRQDLGRQLFTAALPAMTDVTSPRAWAYALLGIDEYLRACQGESSVQSMRGVLAERLLGLYRRVGRRDWPWFEEVLTYCNGRLSQALIASGARMANEEMTGAGLESLRWLAEIQRSPLGHFSPVGSDGFFRRGAPKAEFDQQPVEACAMVSACLEAQRVTEDERWSERAQWAWSWFLGHNHLHQSLVDPATGGCRDGLHRDRVNDNQGAESTLSYLLALLEMRAADRNGIGRTRAHQDNS